MVQANHSLRLHPAVPYMEREATTDDVLPLHNPVVGTDGTTRSELYVQKGQVLYHFAFDCLLVQSKRMYIYHQKIMIPMISLNRLDSVWGDGERFRPERWMKAGASPRDGAISGWSNTMSFSDGPRTCVGWRLGETPPHLQFTFPKSANSLPMSSIIGVQDYRRDAGLSLRV